DITAGTEVEYWEKKHVDGEWELKKVVTSPLGATSLVDITGRTTHFDYYWRVRARKNGLFSAYTADQLVRTLIRPPGLARVSCYGFGGLARVVLTQYAAGTDLIVEVSPVGAGTWTQEDEFDGAPLGPITFPLDTPTDVRAKARDANWTPTDSSYTTLSNLHCP